MTSLWGDKEEEFKKSPKLWSYLMCGPLWRSTFLKQLYHTFVSASKMIRVQMILRVHKRRRTNKWLTVLPLQNFSFLSVILMHGTYVRFCQFSVVGSQVIYAPENCGLLTTKRHLHSRQFWQNANKKGPVIFFLTPYSINFVTYRGMECFIEKGPFW